MNQKSTVSYPLIKRTISILATACVFLSCEQNDPKDKCASLIQSEPNEHETIFLIPKNQDTACIREIEKAKEKVSNGNIVYHYTYKPRSFGLRQEKHLRALCQQNNMILECALYKNPIFEYRTANCYEAYMDQIIANKFGNDFKQKLFDKADSLLSISNDTVTFLECDLAPGMPGANRHVTILPVKLPTKLKKQIKPNRAGELPYIHVGFYIDKSGIASDYYINYFMDSDNADNRKYKNELFDLAVEALKGIPLWEPGEILGQKVISNYNVQVQFCVE